MEAVKEGILMAAGALAFCLAVMMFLYISASVDEAAESVYDRKKMATDIAYETATVLQTGEYQTEGGSVYGWELIAYLMSDYPDTDVMIDSAYMCNQDMNLYSLRNMNLNKQEKYIKEYEYDLEGRISCLVFRKKN